MGNSTCAEELTTEEAVADAATLIVCEDLADDRNEGDSAVVPDDVTSPGDADPSHGAERIPASGQAHDGMPESPASGDIDKPASEATCRETIPTSPPRRKPGKAVVPFVAFVSLCAGTGSALAAHVFPADAGIPVTAEASEDASSTGDEDAPQLPQTGPDLPDDQIEQVERERTSDAQWAVVSEARHMGAAGPSMCLMWVNDVYERAGYGFERLWAASEARQQWCHETNRNELRPGMIVAVEATDTSPLAGHVGIYMGHGEIASNETWGGEGVIRTRGVDDWIAMFGKVDEVRWGWPEGRDLSRETASHEFPNSDHSDTL